MVKIHFVRHAGATHVRCRRNLAIATRARARLNSSPMKPRLPDPTQILRALIVLFGSTTASFGAQAYPPKFDGARVETYKQVGDVALQLHLFEPPAEAAPSAGARAAIVFFFGGGWTNGSPVQFEPQCRYLASRGMVAITADYRVGSRHGVKPTACVSDAKSAMRWVRRNAVRLGIDPKKIAAGGGSAGGHLAAAIATVPGFDEPGEDTIVSALPDALVLFNPALVLAPLDPTSAQRLERVSEERMGTDPRNLSPAHHVKRGTPPTIIFHGRADNTVPFATAEAFAAVMKRAGNRCELVGFDGQGHGFFNYGRAGGRYQETLAETDRFLVSLGFLAAPGANPTRADAPAPSSR